MSPCRLDLCSALSFSLALVSWCTPTAVSASAASTTLFGQSDYHHQVTLASSFSALEYLATFDLGHEGTFEMLFAVEFAKEILQGSDDRVMLYLLACDEAAVAFLELPTSSSSDANNTEVPSYCAMANHTLDFYCQSYPLENQSTNKLVYKASKTVTGAVDNTSTQPEFSILTGSNSTKLTFYIDACELLGGSEAILRSCLEQPPPASGEHSSECFYCPENYPGRSEADDERWTKECVVPPSVREPVEGTVAMELCTAEGECMWETDSYLIAFYAASTTIWGTGGFVWMWYMVTAPPGSAVALHFKLMSVPITQIVYSALSCAAKYTAGQFSSPNFNAVAVAALLAQVVALAQTGEVALFIAAGWGITQRTLERVDVFRVRCVVIEWAVAFVILKQLQVDNVGIAVIWAISWFSLVFLIHYYTTANLKMLRLRYRIGEQVSIDTSLVMWKGTLFLHFRRLQKGFVFIATVAALTGSDNRWHIWEWISVQGHEVLIFLFYAALGYICRCQQFRFSELENLEIEVDAEGPDAADTPESDPAGPVSSSSIIPVIKEPVRKKVATALVLNPDKGVMLGTAYATEKISTVQVTVGKEIDLRVTSNSNADASEEQGPEPSTS